MEDLLVGDKERCGFILCDGTLVEVENVSSEPEIGFEISGSDILKYLLYIEATWHTHPGASSNLSDMDNACFLDWPDFVHYIIGTDGVSCYRVDGNRVVNEKADLLPRPARSVLL